jgi:hypothetical protein
MIASNPMGTRLRVTAPRSRSSLLRAFVLVPAALLLSSQLALAQFTQQGPKLVGTGAVGAPEEGVSVALSADGNTAVVDGYVDNFDSNCGCSTGAGWAYTRSNGVWTQQGTKLGAILIEEGLAVPFVCVATRCPRTPKPLVQIDPMTQAKLDPCLSGCNPQPLALVFGHARGRSPPWRSSAPTIAFRVSATFSRRRRLRRLLGEDALERRVHLPPLSGGGRAVPLR